MTYEDEERRRVADVLGAIVDRIAATQAVRRTQEPAITSKIGQALEDARSAVKEAISDIQIAGIHPNSSIDVRVMVQDIPDRGKGSLEKRSGVDLYVNISVVRGERTKSKGILIQAKKGKKRENLVNQCEKMRDRSNASYAWVYTPDGCIVIDAEKIVEGRELGIDELPHRTPGQVFDRILECSEGDEGLGIGANEGEEQGLERVMRELAAPAGIDFLIHSLRAPRQWRPSRKSFVRRIP